MPRTRSQKTVSDSGLSDSDTESDVTNQYKTSSNADHDKQSQAGVSNGQNCKTLYAATKLLIDRVVKIVPSSNIKNFDPQKTTFPYNAFIITGTNNSGELMYEPGVVYNTSSDQEELKNNDKRYAVKRQRRSDVLTQLAEQELDILNPCSTEETVESTKPRVKKVGGAKKKVALKKLPLPVDNVADIDDVLEKAKSNVARMANVEFDLNSENYKHKDLHEELEEKEKEIAKLKEELMLQKLMNSAVQVPGIPRTESVSSTHQEEFNSMSPVRANFTTTPKSSKSSQRNSTLPSTFQQSDATPTGIQNQYASATSHALSTLSTASSSSSRIVKPRLPSFVTPSSFSHVQSTSDLANTAAVPSISAGVARKVATVNKVYNQPSCSRLLGPGTPSAHNDTSTHENTFAAMTLRKIAPQLPKTKRPIPFKGNVSKKPKLDKLSGKQKGQKRKQNYIRKKKACLYDTDDWENSDSEPADQKKPKLSKWIKEERDEQTGLMIREEMFHLHFGISVPYRAWKKALKQKSSSNFLRRLAIPYVWSYEDFWHKAVQVEKTTSDDDREPFEPKQFEALKRGYAQYLAEKGFINPNPQTPEEEKYAKKNINKYGRELGIIVCQERAKNLLDDNGETEQDVEKSPTPLRNTASHNRYRRLNKEIEDAEEFSDEDENVD